MITHWFLISLLSYAIQVVFIRPPKRIALAIFFLNIYHFLHAPLFYLFTLEKDTDSRNYFLWALEGVDLGYVGSGLIVQIVKAIQFIGISDYYTALLIFTGVSSFGVTLFFVSTYRTLDKPSIHSYWRRFLFLALLLPGLHFWTVPIGKDSIILFLTCLILHCVIRQKHWALAALSIALIGCIRPHVGAAASLAFAAYLLISTSSIKSGRTRFLFRLAISASLLVLGAAFYFFFISYLQKYSVQGFESLADFLSSREDIYADVGSGFDASSIPLPLRFLLFFLGGIPWSTSGLLQVFALVEGLVFVYFLWLAVKGSIRSNSRSMLYDTVTYGKNAIFFGLLLFVVTVALTISYSTGNFGLIVRQRTMVYLPLLLMFLSTSINGVRIKF